MLSGNYQAIKSLARGVYEVKLNNKYGIITADQREVLPVKYDSVVYLKQYLLAKTNMGWEMLKVNEQKTLTTVFSGINSFKLLSNGYLVLEKGGKFGLMTNENEKVSFEFEDIDVCGNRFIYKSAGKYGFLSDEAKALSKALFESITFQDDNLYLVRTKGKYGIIEVTSDMEKIEIKEKIAAKYDFIFQEKRYYYGGYSFVVMDRTKGTSEPKGNESSRE